MVFFYWLTEGQRLEVSALQGESAPCSPYVCLHPGCNHMSNSEAALKHHVGRHFERSSLPPQDHGSPTDDPNDSIADASGCHSSWDLLKRIKTELARSDGNVTIKVLPHVFKECFTSEFLDFVRKLDVGWHPRGLMKVELVPCGVVLSSFYFGRSGSSISLYHRPFDSQLKFSPNNYAWLPAAVGFGRPCFCFVCLDLAVCKVSERIPSNCSVSMQCPKPCCKIYYLDFTKHYRTHLYTKGLYSCDAPSCAYKAKRWEDLKRHTSTIHCLNAKKHSCSFPGCERGGENGFPRKDKLKSHFENVHRGMGIPPKQPRRLAPGP